MELFLNFIISILNFNLIFSDYENFALILF